MPRRMRIGEIASYAGVEVQTVRWYERAGLLRAPTRAENGYRMYDPDAAERLRFIRRAKTLGLTLKEIQQLLTTLDEACCGDVRPQMAALLDDKIAEVDAHISELRSLRERLDVHRGTVLARAHDGTAEASCTPDGCVCLEGTEPLRSSDPDLRTA